MHIIIQCCLAFLSFASVALAQPDNPAETSHPTAPPPPAPPQLSAPSPPPPPATRPTGVAPRSSPSLSAGSAPLATTSAATLPTRRCPVFPEFSFLDTNDKRFTVLRDLRQLVLQALPHATPDRETLKSRYDKLSLERASIMDRASPPNYVSSNEAVLGTQTAKRDFFKSQLDRAKAAGEGADAIRNLENELDKAEQSVKFSTAMLESSRKDVEEQERQNIQRQIRLAQLSRESQEVEAALREISLDVDCLNGTLSKIDETIYTMLIPETQKNSFKLWMSGVFAIMVLVVIIGFFRVSNNDEIVRQAIFSNQTGIQFVTLFSLVIAIILFGITDILQAKELSALLGGISGYILGRVTTERAAASSQPAPRAVSASTIGFQAPNQINSTAATFSPLSGAGRIRISGSAHNNGDFTVVSIAPNVILIAESTIVVENAGASVTIAPV